jgi:hypothetical protein
MIRQAWRIRFPNIDRLQAPLLLQAVADLIDALLS